MPKHKEYAVTLISPGLIVDTLHYGPSCYSWWISRPSEKRENLIFLHPIRLNMKTLVTLKGQDFIIEVVKIFSNYGQIPGYICKCDGIQGELCESLTAAVNSVYKKIFHTNAKYSGPAVMGKLNIWMRFCPELEDDCQVTIYSGNEICNIYVDNNPELVWKKIEILQQYKRKELFGLENNKIQQMVLLTPSSIINWQLLFEDWCSEASTIIELRTKFKKLYPSNHDINDRELRAWKSILKNVGCTKVTPFNKEQSEVRSGSNILPGNSNWFEWQWPTSGDFEGCILARSIPNLGPWTIFTPTELEKLQKREIEKPNPNISTPTISHSNWEVPLPNSESVINVITIATDIRPERLTKQVLVKKLQSRRIVLNGKENKDELVINLEKELNKEMERKKSEQERIVGVLLDVTNGQTIQCDIKKVYPLKAGWALKENQKFGKKGAGKRMTNQVRTLLEGYFMAGNADKSNRYTAQDMQCELEKCAQEGEINKEDVPK
ncbi:21031_t:CDS:2, partial [Rhizophagus irregularis]